MPSSHKDGRTKVDSDQSFCEMRHASYFCGIPSRKVQCISDVCTLFIRNLNVEESRCLIPPRPNQSTDLGAMDGFAGVDESRALSHSEVRVGHGSAADCATFYDCVQSIVSR